MIDAAIREGELEPSRMELSSHDLAAMLISAAHGIEVGASTPAMYHRRLREIVRVIVAGLAGSGVSSAARGA
jgi:NADH:ubiquinone oxidoreductase subunit D